MSRVLEMGSTEVAAAAQEATGETIDPGLNSRVELNVRLGRLKKKFSAQAVVYAFFNDACLSEMVFGGSFALDFFFIW